MKRWVILCSVIAIMLMAIGVLAAGGDVAATTENSKIAQPHFEFVPAPPEVQQMLAPTHAPTNYVPKRPGHYSAQDWRAVIDSTWGPGLPPATSQSIWGYWWEFVDQNFAAFQGLSPGNLHRAGFGQFSL